MTLQPQILPEQLQQQLQSELRTGEKLIWADQPLPRLLGRKSIPIVLFGIPWTAFSIFWITMASIGTSHGATIFFPLFGVPFVLIGLGMITAPFWSARRAARIVYAVTDRRAIIIQGKVFGGISVRSFLPDRLTSMTRNERPDGNGDLIFEQFQESRGSGTTTVRRGFMGVRNVREIEDLILNKLVSARAR